MEGVPSSRTGFPDVGVGRASKVLSSGGNGAGGIRDDVDGDQSYTSAFASLKRTPKNVCEKRSPLRHLTVVPTGTRRTGGLNRDPNIEITFSGGPPVDTAVAVGAPLPEPDPCAIGESISGMTTMRPAIEGEFASWNVYVPSLLKVYVYWPPAGLSAPADGGSPRLGRVRESNTATGGAGTPG